jgi:hypothetical protein
VELPSLAARNGYGSALEFDGKNRVARWTLTYSIPPEGRAAMQNSLGPALLGFLVLVLHAAPGLSEPLSLRSGSYRVAVRMKLPHLDNVNTETVTQICLSSAAGSNNHGISVLSANNPLANCPISNIYEDAGQLAFDIFCEGKNTARAKAHYEVKPDDFSGRIVMQMGGKNMTMTEVQTGHRIGPCEGSKAPSL